MLERTKRLSRRNFLLTAATGGVAAAAGLAARNAPPGPRLAKDVPPRSRGYQATEHVNHYYQTAKV